MKNDLWHICSEANVNSEQACLDAYRRAHRPSGSNSQPTTSTALWAYWWLTNSAQRFSTCWALFRAISVAAYQTVCHKHVYHPFPKFRQVSSSSYSVWIYAHVGVSSLVVGWTTASNSGQNYSPHVFLRSVQPCGISAAPYIKSLSTFTWRAFHKSWLQPVEATFLSTVSGEATPMENKVIQNRSLT